MIGFIHLICGLRYKCAVFFDLCIVLLVITVVFFVMLVQLGGVMMLFAIFSYELRFCDVQLINVIGVQIIIDDVVKRRNMRVLLRTCTYRT